MPITLSSALERTRSVTVARAITTPSGLPVNLNGTLAFSLTSYDANVEGTYIVECDRAIATVVAGTYNAGTPVYLNVATPGTNVQSTGGAGFRAVGYCLKNYGTLGLGDKIEISFNGSLPKGS